MLITLNTQTFDLDGTVELDVTLDRGDQRRRMNRIATLDGGLCSMTPILRGRPHDPRDLAISRRGEESAIARMVRLYQRLILSCDEGVFLVAPESYKATGGQLVAPRRRKTHHLIGATPCPRHPLQPTAPPLW